MCSLCGRWVHHNNRLNCSALSDSEYNCHVNDKDRYYECDTCLCKRKSKTFSHLPFSVESEGNLFNSGTKKIPDVRSMTQDELDKFTAQCASIQKHVESDCDVDDFFPRLLIRNII